MNVQKWSRYLLFVVLLAGSLTACGKKECELICDIDEKEYTLDVTCESGGAQCQAERSRTTGPKGNLIKFSRNDDCTYGDSGNTYHIEGEINFDANEKVKDYHFEVTGGAFGDEPQVCEYP